MNWTIESMTSNKWHKHTHTWMNEWTKSLSENLFCMMDEWMRSQFCLVCLTLFQMIIVICKLTKNLTKIKIKIKSIDRLIIDENHRQSRNPFVKWHTNKQTDLLISSRKMMTASNVKNSCLFSVNLNRRLSSFWW